VILRSILAIAIGSSLGALLRWWLGLFLDAHFPTIPPGTLAANLIGGYIIGVAVAVFAAYSALAPEWRLLVITGFCGGLTTFSTFSAESVTLLQQGRMLWAAGHALAHLSGSILMTFAGIGTVAWLRSLRPAPHPTHPEVTSMQGSFLRFYVHENQRHQRHLVWEWLLQQANALGIRGGSAFRAMAGFGRHHVLHESTFFELAGTLTVEVEFIVTDEEAQKLLRLLHEQGVRLFYACVPALFGVINPDATDPPGTD
jgi:protein CrcB